MTTCVNKLFLFHLKLENRLRGMAEKLRTCNWLLLIALFSHLTLMTHLFAYKHGVIKFCSKSSRNFRLIYWKRRFFQILVQYFAENPPDHITIWIYRYQSNFYPLLTLKKILGPCRIFRFRTWGLLLQVASSSVLLESAWSLIQMVPFQINKFLFKSVYHEVDVFW